MQGFICTRGQKCKDLFVRDARSKQLQEETTKYSSCCCALTLMGGYGLRVTRSCFGLYTWAPKICCSCIPGGCLFSKEKSSASFHKQQTKKQHTREAKKRVIYHIMRVILFLWLQRLKPSTNLFPGNCKRWYSGLSNVAAAAPKASSGHSSHVTAFETSTSTTTTQKIAHIIFFIYSCATLIVFHLFHAFLIRPHNNVATTTTTLNY